MANKRIILDPSTWILDKDNKINIRYRILTDDLNVKSAFSPTYSISVPAIDDIFANITSTITTETINGQVVIRLVWSTEPQYDTMQYFVFLKGPSDTDYAFIKSTTDTSYSYVIDSTASGVYDFKVTLPNTTKTPLANTVLFTKTTTI